MLEKIKMYNLQPPSQYNCFEQELKLKNESDIFLTDEVKGGNEDAFKILVERYNYIISYNISNMSFAFPGISSKLPEKEDLYQECCIVLYKAAKYYDLMKNVKFSTYANVCVKNYLVSFFKKYSKKNCEIISIDDIPENERGRYDQYFILGNFIDFNDFIMVSGLTNFERRVFLMYIESKSYKYIAEILNKSVKSIDNAVYRIKSKLKPYVESFIYD